MGKIVSINISEKKGTKKYPVLRCEMIENFGFVSDAHAGDSLKQISLLDNESIIEAKNRGIDVSMGDFAENITTQGLELLSLSIGARLKLGNGIIEITQLGKNCHRMCDVGIRLGECIMPKNGVFAKVIKGSMINVGDGIEIIS